MAHDVQSSRTMAHRSAISATLFVVGIAVASCSHDSELGSCGYGAQLDTTYACEGNVQVTTREQCPPKPALVTRKDCSAEGKQCLEMVALPGQTSALFTCVQPCTTDSDCPTDTYCGSGPAKTMDGRKTCTPSLKEGFSCDVTTRCASGLVCALERDAGTGDADVPDAQVADAATPAQCQPFEYLCSCQRP